MTALHKTKWFLPLFSVALGSCSSARSGWAANGEAGSRRSL